MTTPLMRTPEHEAKRLEKLREALRKPRPPEWRKHQSEGQRRSFANGRVAKRTPESIEKGAAKLRGRKRPHDVMEKVRVANTGKVRSEETRRKYSEVQKKAYREGRSGISKPGVTEKALTAARRANTGRARTEEERKHHSELMKGRKPTPELVARRVAPMIGRPQTKPLVAKGPDNKQSISGDLRSKENVVYSFTNLTHFVREHSELFDPKDLVWFPKYPYQCNASKRLLALFGKGKVVPGSWKGWTVYSTVERDLNFGQDLLDRNTVIP